jgi:hypothetical protein
VPHVHRKYFSSTFGKRRAGAATNQRAPNQSQQGKERRPTFQPTHRNEENTMNTRKLISALAFAVVAGPIAAHADAPSGDFDQVFKVESKSAQPQFPRSEYRLYVEHWIDEQIAANKAVAKTREQVRMEISAQPLPVVGA